MCFVVLVRLGVDTVFDAVVGVVIVAVVVAVAAMVVALTGDRMAAMASAVSVFDCIAVIVLVIPRTMVMGYQW
jgi:hypothetical protein